jgi:hypothetical protein
MTRPNTAALRATLAGILAVHTNQLAAAIRNTGTTATADDRPGLARAVALLGQHQADPLADQEPPAITMLLDAMVAALAADTPAQPRVENAPADPGERLAQHIFAQPAHVVRAALRHLGWPIPDAVSGEQRS